MDNQIKPPVRTSSAIVTNLAVPYDAMVEALWNEFHLDCGVAMQLAAYPVAHLSWQGAESYDLPGLYEILTGIARGTPPFTARLAGVGMFTHPAQVVYLTVVKGQQMTSFHRQIWDQTASLGADINRYYAPSIWMPHITLAYNTHDPEALKCILRKLLYRHFDWEVRIDHLALLHSGANSLLVKGEQFPLKGVV